MKAIPSIAFNDFSGTAGNVTARSTSGGKILSVRPFPCKVCSQSQRARRNALATISRAYKQLTDNQMKGWASLAEKLKGTSLFGKSAELTAHNAFVRINSNRIIAGMPLLEEAPVYKSDVQKVEYSDFWITPKRIVFTGLVQLSDTYRLVMKMSRNSSAGVSSDWGNTVIITSSGVSDWGDLELTDDYIKTMGFAPVAGQKYFLEFWWLDTETGFTGESEKVSAICREESAESGTAFVPRARVTLREVKESEGVDEIDLEVSEGSAILSIDSHYINSTGVSSTNLILKKDNDHLPKEDACVLGRTSDPERGYLLRPMMFLIWIRTFAGRTKITYVFRGGQYNNEDVRVFGTSPMYKK